MQEPTKNEPIFMNAPCPVCGATAFTLPHIHTNKDKTIVAGLNHQSGNGSSATVLEPTRTNCTPGSCPFAYGAEDMAWGMSPEGWAQARETHDKYHVTKTKWEENSEKEEWGGWKIISDMLDNPDEHGIYPTSEAYQKLYEFVVAQKLKSHLDTIEELRGEVEKIHTEDCKLKNKKLGEKFGLTFGDKCICDEIKKSDVLKLLKK